MDLVVNPEHHAVDPRHHAFDYDQHAVDPIHPMKESVLIQMAL